MFIDSVIIEVEAGRGGNGAVSFRREKYIPRGGPDGGDGGHGCSITLQASDDVNTLVNFRYNKVFRAQAGVNGAGANRHGKNGESLIIKVPVGTIVFDDEAGRLLVDIDTPEQQFELARGGKGGRGNARFATSVNRAPKNAEMGLPGQSFRIRLELKLMADVGLIGYPNVGKSTLLSVISAAKPKIGDYPFTTLSPNLGVVWLKENEQSFVIADIPGLIQGAHEGKGLGHRFLRHIERTRLLVHMVDIAGVEGRDPLEDYRQINDELVAFNPRLAGLRQIVALNKVDLLQSREPIEEFKKGVGDVEVLEISAATTQGTKALVLRLAELVKILPRTRLFAPEDLYQEIELAPVQGIVISREGDVFYLSGRRVDILAAKTDFNNDESLANFYRVAKKMGVFELLKSEGIKPGDTVVIADREFSYE